MAIQPPQADQPEGFGSGGPGSGGPGGNPGATLGTHPLQSWSWVTIVIGVSALIALMALALGLAPIVKCSGLQYIMGLPVGGAPTPRRGQGGPQMMLQPPQPSESRNRLVGEFLFNKTNFLFCFLFLFHKRWPRPEGDDP